MTNNRTHFSFVMAYDRFRIIILLAKELILVSDSCISFADLVILSGSAVCSTFYIFDSVVTMNSDCATPRVVFYLLVPFCGKRGLRSKYA